MKKIFALLLLLFLATACKNNTNLTSTDLLRIDLAGDLSERILEASGMAWYKDNLIILPQFPHKWNEQFDGALFYIKKERIERYINGEDRTPIQGKKLHFIAEGLDAIGKRKGSGYEAITFIDDTVFVSIESVNNSKSTDFVIKGIIDFDQKKVVLDANSKIEIKSQTGIHNMGEETILQFRNNIYTIHEANGVNVNPAPTASKLDMNLKQIVRISFPNVEYRISDATRPDSTGRFFALNYYYPGEYKKLKPNLNNAQKEIAIEKILEFQINDTSIVKTEEEPIILDNSNSKGGRNWEGIVKLNNGFLIVTDMYPETLLVYYEMHE